MTARELFEWAAFERVYGPVTVQERVDVAGAITAYATAAAAGAKDVRPEDFLPEWAKHPANRAGTDEQTDDDIMNVFRSLV